MPPRRLPRKWRNGFAIPISKAQDILNSLMTKKTRVAVSEDAQGYLGIQGTNIDAATSQMYGMPVGIYVYKSWRAKQPQPLI